MKKRHLLSILAALLMVGFVVAQSSRYAPESGKYTGRVWKTQPMDERPERIVFDDVYSSNDSIRIPDYPGDTAVSVINVRDGVTIQDINVFVDIRHPYIRDLRISVTAPGDSTEVVLLNLFPGDSVVNIQGWFDDAIDSSIFQATPPLIGSWRPRDSLRTFNGLSSAGNWTLRVYDRFHVDSGYIAGWAIDINHPVVLEGNARDAQTRLPLSGVLVKPMPSYFSTMTDVNGHFSFNQLEPGTYSVRFTKRFFDTVLVENVEIVTGEVRQITANMLRTGGGELVNENFDATLRHHLPEGWIQISVDSGNCADFEGPSVWQVMDADTDELGAHSAPKMVANFFNDTTLAGEDVANDDWLVLPQINATGNITMKYWAQSQDARYLEHIEIRVSTTEAVPDSFTTLIQNTAAVPSAWTQYTHDLSEFSGQPFYVAFHYISSNMFVIKIDDVLVEYEVTEAAPEPAPRIADDWTFRDPYPNPFNASVEFRFDLAHRGKITLRLYNTLGQLVSVVADQSYDAGSHAVRFDAGGMASGLYIASMTVGSQSQNRKIILLK